jgi:hypothetical protein
MLNSTAYDISKWLPPLCDNSAIDHQHLHQTTGFSTLAPEEFLAPKFLCDFPVLAARLPALSPLSGAKRNHPHNSNSSSPTWQAAATAGRDQREEAAVGQGVSCKSHRSGRTHHKCTDLCCEAKTGKGKLCLQCGGKTAGLRSEEEKTSAAGRCCRCSKLLRKDSVCGILQLDGLPLALVLSHLAAPQLLRAERVCRTFREASANDEVSEGKKLECPECFTAMRKACVLP